MKDSPDAPSGTVLYNITNTWRDDPANKTAIIVIEFPKSCDKDDMTVEVKGCLGNFVS